MRKRWKSESGDQHIFLIREHLPFREYPYFILSLLFKKKFSKFLEHQCHLRMPSTYSLNKVAYKLASRPCINKLHQGHGHAPSITCTSEQVCLSSFFFFYLFFSLFTIILPLAPLLHLIQQQTFRKQNTNTQKWRHAHMQSRDLLHHQNCWQHNP